MERPQVNIQPKQRDITGEVVYLDEKRQQNEEPKLFLELGDTAIRMYKAKADVYKNGKRPDIMDEYEQFDSKPSEVVASCTALANELLTLKEPESSLTFVDIAVEANPQDVLAKLKTITAGTILSGEGEQLAMPSNGEYYPVLDIRKQTARLVGVGLRAWGWDDKKYVFTNKEGEQFTYPQHALVYPSDEKSSTRQLEISFSYRDEKSGGFSESISLYLTAGGSATISSNVWAMAYAETGYEGHRRASVDSPTDEDIAAFGDLIAEIVGDKPESISMKINQQLQELADAAATPSARQAIEELIEVTWPAQASYFLKSKTVGGTGQSIAKQLCNETTADAATAAVRMIIEEWNARCG